MKLATPVSELLANGMNWVSYTPEPLVRFIGVSELLGAVGLVVPAATRIQPRLTTWAAGGLVTVMVLAAFTHLTHREAAMVPVNVVLGGLAAFVAWGRSVKAPAPAAGAVTTGSTPCSTRCASAGPRPRARRSPRSDVSRAIPGVWR
ncbi:MAG: DoxX family protein [Deltaproteobacteria bacterium]|nr:DoxX family protein [Deltaproteobacteria bacterium]